MSSLTVVTPAGSLDLIAQTRAHLRLDHTLEDARLPLLIAAAVSEIEALTGRQLLQATYDLKLDAFPAWIEVPKPPLVSVTSVTYTDAAGAAQTLAAATYVVTTPGGQTGGRGTLRLASGQTWPTTYEQPNVVTVRFVAGYGTTVSAVPAAIQAAILLWVEALFDPSVDERVRETALRLLAPFRSRLTQEQ